MEDIDNQTGDLGSEEQAAGGVHSVLWVGAFRLQQMLLGPISQPLSPVLIAAAAVVAGSTRPQSHLGPCTSLSLPQVRSEAPEIRAPANKGPSEV